MTDATQLGRSWWGSPRLRLLLKAGIIIALLSLVVLKLKFSAVPVLVHELGLGRVEARVMGTGTLEARVSTIISPRLQERLAEVLVDQGDAVQAGQLLARLDDGELRQQVAVAEAALEAARATADKVRLDEARAQAVEEQARQNFERVSDLLNDGVSSRADYDKAFEQLRVAETDLKRAHAATVEAAHQVSTSEKSLSYQREQLAHTRIESPYAGLIVRRDRDPGGVVVPGSSILELVDTNEMWISAWVDETAAARLEPGQEARVVFRSEPDREYAGEVARLGRETDRETREFLVDVGVRELPRNWTVGQRAEVYVRTGSRDSALVLPGAYIAWRKGEPGAFIMQSGKAQWRGISVGLEGDEGVEIVGGLERGDQVIRLAPERRGALMEGERVKAE